MGDNNEQQGIQGGQGEEGEKGVDPRLAFARSRADTPRDLNLVFSKMKVQEGHGPQELHPEGVEVCVFVCFLFVFCLFFVCFLFVFCLLFVCFLYFFFCIFFLFFGWV